MNTKIKKKKESIEDKVLKGSRLAVRKLIEERKKTNDYLIVSKNGKIVKIKARNL